VIDEMKDLPAADQVLYVDLKGRDPDEGMTQVPYVKGMLFLRRLEEVFGREQFDAFLRGYFNQFAFRSIVTADFVDYLKNNLLNQNRDLAARIDLEEWLTKPGLPANTPQPKSDALAKTETAAKDWAAGKRGLSAFPVSTWSTYEWLHFLRSLPEKLDAKRMAELDSAFRLTESGNSEILAEWLLMSIESGYRPAYPKLDRFLMEVGRRKYIKPLYQELAKTTEGKAHAKTIYAKARPGYHPIAAATVDDLLK
jgi:leukotriene-A4 hydrolase